MSRLIFALFLLLFSVSFSPPANADALASYPECTNAPHRNLCLVLERVRDFSYVSYTEESLEAKVLSTAKINPENIPVLSECAKYPYSKVCSVVMREATRPLRRQKQEYFLSDVLARFIDHYYYWSPYRKADFGSTETIIPWGGGQGRVDIYDGAIEPQDSIFAEYGVSRSINFRSSYKDGICFVYWSEFDMRVVPKFDSAIEKCQSLGGMKGIIIDIRGNPGGNLRSTLTLASEFLPENAILMYDQDKDTQPLSPVQGWYSTKHHLAKIPLVILVDRDSASASEILAGSLQCYKRAVILSSDSRTYGKYTGQQIFSFDDSSWAVAFTVTEWYLPNKKSNKGGLTPDFVIPKGQIMQKAKDVLLSFPYSLPVILSPE